MLNSNEMCSLLENKLQVYFASNLKSATKEQVGKAIALVLRDIMLAKKQKNNQRIQKEQKKRVYYLCMEFLLGRSLKNNVYNLGVESAVRDSLKGLPYTLDDLYDLEDDAGLGNGGLGRLAACFMDSLATLNYPAMGFSIRYEYGLFKQKIVENQQVELPDMWLNTGEVWMMPRSDKCFEVKIGGYVHEEWREGKLIVEHRNATTIEALPYDIMIPGAESDGVSTLRLWRAAAANNFDMKSFTQGDYMMAMRADNEAELVSKVLYPADDHEQGKILRLTQQYFLVSASLQSIIKDHFKVYKNLDNFADKVAIHINDTHPALAIPELMRLLIDEYGYNWERSWEIVTTVMGYTNHTVLQEALEKWSEYLVKMRLPRIYNIIKEIDNRFRGVVWDMTHDSGVVENTAVISDGMVKMANLSVIGSHSVNGVSALHSKIIKDSVFSDYYRLFPSRFTNVTNGIAHRRWLCQSNPLLTDLITELIGDKFILEPERLIDLKKYENDKSVLNKLEEIKKKNKIDYAKFVFDKAGFKLNPETRTDTQIKRLHEYKRQLMNVMKIVHIFNILEENPNADITPQTFIFGAKAAGGYFHAKRVISLINCLSKEIEKNPKIREKLNVYFIENYNVTNAEHLIPASEVSEQISLAGKEASGTSNMKFMMNGAITLGTVDGANVEIMESVGNDNIFTFGLSDKEVESLWKSGYYPSRIYASDERVRRVVDRIKVGFSGVNFSDIASYLLLGSNNIADPYMNLMDFASYLDACDRLDKAYHDKNKWNKMALVNIAESGRFAADRSITDYARDIWGLERVAKIEQEVKSQEQKIAKKTVKK